MFLLLVILLYSTLLLKYGSCLDVVPINKIFRRKNYDAKIFSGSNTNIAAYPSMVAVLGNGYIICGGTIIGWTTVLSAAHCFNKQEYRVVYSIRSNSTYSAIGGTIYTIKKVILHDKFESVYLSYDFAVAITRSYFMKYQIAPIARAPVPTGTTVRVVGWGASEQYSTMDILQHAELTILSESLCKSWLQEYQIKRSMLCAASVTPGVDTCRGDSGGPLFYGKILAGVTSWGVSCGKRFPGVYGNVSYVYRWIDKFL